MPFDAAVQGIKGALCKLLRGLDVCGIGTTGSNRVGLEQPGGVVAVAVAAIELASLDMVSAPGAEAGAVLGSSSQEGQGDE